MIETIQRIQQLAEPNALGAITNAALCRCDNLHHPTCPCGANTLCNECDTTIYGQDENWVRNNFEKFRELVRKASDIFSQVGVTFDIGDRISIANIPDAFDICEEVPTNSDVAATNTMWTFDQLVDVRSGTGGLEVYFVNKIVSDGRRGNTVGLFTADGIAIARAGTGVTLAYEVGHAFGMEDVYSDKVNGDELRGFSCSARLPDDWSGGAAGNGSAGARYYRSGRRQTDIVKSMLMNGCTKSSSTGIDVSYGMVSVTVRCSARPTIARRATAEGRNIAILHLSI